MNYVFPACGDHSSGKRADGEDQSVFWAERIYFGLSVVIEKTYGEAVSADVPLTKLVLCRLNCGLLVGQIDVENLVSVTKHFACPPDVA